MSADMRTLLASADPRAAQAVEIFCYRAVREIGSLVAASRRARRGGVHRRHRRERGTGARAHPAARSRGSAIDLDADGQRSPRAAHHHRAQRGRRLRGARPTRSGRSCATRSRCSAVRRCPCAAEYHRRPTAPDERDERTPTTASRRTRSARCRSPPTTCGARRRSARSTTSRSASTRFRWGRPVIRAFGILKKCAALANGELGRAAGGEGRADRARGRRR